MSVSYSLPISVLLYFVVNGIHQNIQFATLEKYGNAHQQPLSLLLEHLSHHQLMVSQTLGWQHISAGIALRQAGGN